MRLRCTIISDSCGFYTSRAAGTSFVPRNILLDLDYEAVRHSSSSWSRVCVVIPNVPIADLSQSRFLSLHCAVSGDLLARHPAELQSPVHLPSTRRCGCCRSPGSGCRPLRERRGSCRRHIGDVGTNKPLIHCAESLQYSAFQQADSSYLHK